MKVILPISLLVLAAFVVHLGAPAPVLAQKKKANELVLKDGKAEVDASLSADDKADAVRKEHRYKVFTVALKAGMSYQIDMRSKSIDCYLRLEDANGKQLAKDDDSGGDLNARIVFACTADATYRIICTTYRKAELGKFHLKVQKK